jgi:type IV pilus assembly protein PilW
MKAIYGLDIDADNRVTGDCPGAEWTTTPPTDWTTVRAIRVAILVRSSQFERSADATASAAVSAAVTTANPRWSCGQFLMTNVDGGADSFSDTQSNPNNWRYYRYQVYEKVIPLRNMIWGQQP